MQTEAFHDTHCLEAMLNERTTIYPLASVVPRTCRLHQSTLEPFFHGIHRGRDNRFCEWPKVYMQMLLNLKLLYCIRYTHKSIASTHEKRCYCPLLIYHFVLDVSFVSLIFVDLKRLMRIYLWLTWILAIGYIMTGAIY